MEVVLFYTPQLYTHTIQVLRNQLGRSRGGHVNVAIWAEEDERDLLEMRLNRHDLYLEGFRRQPDGPWYRFRDAPPWAGATPLSFGGSHRELGTTLDTTSFTNATRFAAGHIKRFQGGEDKSLRDGLCYFVVAISEAVRFPAIEQRVSESLNGIRKYCPKQDHETCMSKWKTKSAAGSADVAVRSLG